MGSDARNTHCVLDSDDFVNDTKMVIDFMANYYNKVEEYPVQSQVKPGYLLRQLPDSAPNGPESLEDILKDVNDSIIPGITHWQSPNFFAWFPASASTAGYVGEMLCSGLNVVGFNWIASPAATELENIIMDWMAKMLKLPSSFMFSGGGGGVLHGTTCEAIVCTLAAARDEVLRKYGDDKITKLVVYASDQTHSTVRKASKLVGIPPANFRSLVTTSDSGFTLSPQALQEAIEADIGSGLVPLFVCGTVGTTGCGAVDPLEEVGKIARKYNLWFHVDAAYAGNACICPEFRHCLDGVELADSFSLNAHKWFLTNLSCCCLWVKEPSALVESLSSDPEYLRNHPSELQKMVDYKDWQIALTRRFNALKLWVVIRRHGVANLRSHIRTDVNMAKRFESLVAGDNRFELVVPRSFALVCFRLKPRNGWGGLELNCKLLAAVNQSGRAFMTHAVVGGVYFIRCVVGSTLTEEHHVDALWTLIQEKASMLLLQH